MKISIEGYLTELKQELIAADPATCQDALADAEEHLRFALEQAVDGLAETDEADVLEPIIEKYGSPAEIAAAYLDIEERVKPALAVHRRMQGPSSNRFLGILSDPRAWGALLYMLLAGLTGTLYFCWTVTGLSLSLSTLILIIGLPITALFLLSIRSLALLEGRIVEGLLGVRMPRRPIFRDRSAGWWQQVKDLLIDKHTWSAVLYMVLQFPLGVTYFIIVFVLLTFSLTLMASPILELVFQEPLIRIGSDAYHVMVWQMPLLVGAGFLLLLCTLHLTKVLGRAHAWIARRLLVGVR